jgi:hypothetical protein
MTRNEVLEWLEKELGIRSYLAIGDSGAIHRLEWIAVATTLGDWTLDDIKSAIDQTVGIEPLPKRIDEIFRMLEWRRRAKWQGDGEMVKR